MLMLTRRAFAALIAASAVPVTIGSAVAAAERGHRDAHRPPTKGSRAAEVRAIREFAEITNPRGIEAAQNPAWRQSWERLEGRAPVLGDGEYVVELRRALGWFREGHTTVLPFEFLGSAPAPLARGPWGWSYPVKAAAFHDGLWIVEAAGGALPLLGGRITRIGSHPIEDVITAHARAWPAENPAWAHAWAPQLLHHAGALQGLGIAVAGDRLSPEIEVEFPDGRQAVASLHAEAGDVIRQGIVRTATIAERDRADAGTGNFTRLMSAERALYVSIDDMADGETTSFATFSEHVLQAAGFAGVDRVLIDLRRNGGGDNYLGEPLRHELARSRFNRLGGLYVLIGPRTFSAAQNFANRLERETMAIFVGEPSGSAPNHVGDPGVLEGPVTGVTVIVGKARWFDGGPDDRRRWIFPDLYTPSTALDWLVGIDAALDAAVRHQVVTEESFALRSRHYARASQDTTWRPYWIGDRRPAELNLRAGREGAESTLRGNEAP
jgi:hypothetical protein